MSKLGNWEVKVSVSGMPQRVATAVSALSEQLIGAEYTPIAYLGSQVVNGTNHAVLAQQLITTGKDTKNLVLLIFNEKGVSDCTLVNIERVVEGGGEFGGTQIDVSTAVPEEAQKAFDETLAGFVGSRVEIIAYIGSKITKGTEYKFACTVTPVVPDAKPSVCIVTVNSMTKKLSFENIFA